MGLFGFGRRKKEESLSSDELYAQGAELFDKGDWGAAIPLIEKAAQMGHSAAQNHLGVDYQRGEGVPKDIQKAVYWYQKAIDQNNPKAMRNLGRMYQSGKDVPKDVTKAVELITRAAQLGLPSAQNSLAILYEDGIGVTKDVNEAIKWYQKAIDQGNIKAIYNMGTLYYNGTGIPKDLEKAREYWQKAAELGHTTAKKDLEELEQRLRKMRKTEAASQSPEELYTQGAELFNKGDWGAAIPLIEKAAQMGHSAAQNHLGVDYQRGEGVPKDIQKAVYWYQKAIDQNNPKAMNNLGRMYKNGKEIPQDIKKAVELITRAAQLGLAGAQNSLAIMYQDGVGVPQDTEAAIQWYQKAAEQGNTKAVYNLGLLYYNGSCVSRDLQKTRDYWQKAVDMGDETTKKDLAEVEELLQQQRKTVAEQKPKAQTVSLSQVEVLLQEAVAAYRKEDFSAALERFKAAGKLSHPYAAYLAAEMYLRPDLLDYSQAELWAQKAKKAGYAGAETLLRRIYSNAGSYYLSEAESVKEAYIGEHFGSMEFDVLMKEAENLPVYKRLYALAVEHMKKAAQQDDAWSMVSLANNYYWNYYPDEDMERLEQAAYWIQRATQLGDSAAKMLERWICKLYYSEKGLQLCKTDEKKALVYFRKGAEYGDRSSMFNAAICLYNNYRDRSSMQEALEWATKAEQHGMKDTARLIQSIKTRL